ncbi:MAG: flagellar biosynthesis protein FlhB [Pseudomonadota bacterium]
MAGDGEEEDDASKTEEPTHKRIEDAVERGQVINSREVTSFMALTTLAIIVAWVFPLIFKFSALNFKLLIEHSGSININYAECGNLLKYNIGKALVYLSPVFLLVIVATLFSHLMQQGQIVFTFEPVTPDISKLSVFKGFKKIFSAKNFVEFLKNLLKLTIVGVLIYLIVLSDIQELRMYQDLSVGGILIKIHSLINHIMISVCITLAAIAGADYFYQRYEYFRSMKMTKQEVKEEYKQTEGNPEIKKRQRQKRYELSKRPHAQTVPEATVIITNPEHFAIALQYEEKSMNAPIVIAKGLDAMALQIRKIAEDHDVPIVESPPLARALYKEVEVDYPIPFEHYDAVAKIISYVFSLKQNKKKK